MMNYNPPEVHEKLGLCYASLEDTKLSLYHYTQQISLAPSATAWSHIALLSIKVGSLLIHKIYKLCEVSWSVYGSSKLVLCLSCQTKTNTTHTEYHVTNTT